MQLIPAQKSGSGSGMGTVIICAILAIVLVIFLILPKYSAYSASKQLTAQNAAELEDLKSKQTQLDSIYEKMKSKTVELDEVDEAIPNKPGIPELYAYFEALTKSVNLTIGSIQAVDTSAEQSGNTTDISVAAGGVAAAPSSISPTLGVIDVNMQVTGNFSDFVSFLSKLQKSLRLIDVQSINVTATEGREGLTFMASMRTYYQK